jgi:hypothetical protein
VNRTPKQRIEFGDFQTPEILAFEICQRLAELGIRPDVVIEPTCGVGAFVDAAVKSFPEAQEILGFDINNNYLNILQEKLKDIRDLNRVHLKQSDFFTTDWTDILVKITGSVLVIGNFPWVTNAAQGIIGGKNLPDKSNFQRHNGLDAITGKANFDISEWMLLEVLRWFEGRAGDIAMLVKSSVARKILAHAERQNAMVSNAFMIGIDAKKEFNAAVEACLLVLRLSDNAKHSNHDYTMFENLHDMKGRRVGHREGLIVGDLVTFSDCAFLVGKSPQKWRSGIKHDASGVMEFTRKAHGLENGLGEVVDIESEYLFPLMKGSDIGSSKGWRSKYMLVTQRAVGEPTQPIQDIAPRTWDYLLHHAAKLDARGSIIYKNNPRFSIFGVGDYAFLPWRIAICGLYKKLQFRLIEPMHGKPVMFDDTVYYLSFETEEKARDILDKLNSKAAISLLSSLIFWDEKRPIKTSILNVLDWSRLALTDGLLFQGEAKSFTAHIQ